MYPLFKRSAPDLSGAAVRVHITLSPAHLTPAQEQLSAPEESYLEDVSDTEIREAESFAHAKDSHHQNVEIQQQRKTSGDCEGQDSQVENTFAVSITVERAMHLSLKGKTSLTFFFKRLNADYYMKYPVFDCLCLGVSVYGLSEVIRGLVFKCFFFAYFYYLKSDIKPTVHTKIL